MGSRSWSGSDAGHLSWRQTRWTPIHGRGGLAVHGFVERGSMDMRRRDHQEKERQAYAPHGERLKPDLCVDKEH